MTTASAVNDDKLNFLKTAIALGALDRADAARILRTVKQHPQADPAELALKNGLMNAEACEQVRARLRGGKPAKAQPAKGTASKASGSGERKRLPQRPRRKGSDEGRALPKGRKGGRRRPPARRKKSAAPAVLCALGAGALVGVAVVIGLKGDASGGDTVAVAPAPSTTESAIVPAHAAPAPRVEASTTAPVPAPQTKPAAAVKSTADDPALRSALNLAIRTAGKLQESEQERVALEVVDEFIASHGKVKEALEARATILANCRDLLANQTPRIRKLAKEYRTSKAAQIVAALRERLPAELHGELNALAVEIQGSEPAPAKPEPAEIKVAAAPVPEPQPVAAAPVAKPEPRPEPRRELASTDPEPEPFAGGDEDEGEDDDFGSLEEEEEDDDDDGMAIDTTSPIAEAVNELLGQRHKLRKNGQIEVNYSFSQGGELEDFDSANFDKIAVTRMDGVHFVSRQGLEVGAGSQRMGRFFHALPLDGDFEIETELWFGYAGGRTQVVFLLGRKMGVNFGQQICKVSKSGRIKPLTPVCDRLAFRAERLVKVKISYVDGLLSVFCNGRKTAEKKIKQQDIRGQFGLLAKDVRLQLTSLRIKGSVDTNEL